jgi:hypothetical protein
LSANQSRYNGVLTKKKGQDIINKIVYIFKKKIHGPLQNIKFKCDQMELYSIDGTIYSRTYTSDCGKKLFIRRNFRTNA